MLRILGVFFAFILTAACGHFANLGIDSERLDTANKQLAAYSGEISALAQFGERLVVTGVITQEQAIRAADHLDEALETIRVAQAQITATGDPIAAESALDRVRLSIDLALGILTAFAPEETAYHLQKRERLKNANFFIAYADP